MTTQPNGRTEGRRRRTGTALAAAWLVTGLVAGGGAVAVAQSTPDQYTGCLANGMLVEVAAGDQPAGGECRRGEQVTWNVAGVPGPQGPQGAMGPEGPAGPQGPAGDTVPSTRWYRDADADGYGAYYDWLDSAAQPPGYVENNRDCYDQDAELNPDHPDDGGNGVIDSNCDGEAADGWILTWYRDQDGDGWGAVQGDVVRRPRGDGPLEGYALNSSDCNDWDRTRTPYTPDCWDRPRAPGDWDGDGHDAPVMGGDDCDDFDRGRYPGNSEQHDAYDHDGDCNPHTVNFMPYDPDFLDPRVVPNVVVETWSGRVAGGYNGGRFLAPFGGPVRQPELSQPID